MRLILRIGLLVIFSILAILFFVLDPAKHNFFPKCYFHSFTGLNCPGCGSQRAIHDLLHLNIGGTIRNNFLFLPAMMLIIYHFGHPVLNRKFNLRLPDIFYMKLTPWIIFAVVIIFWILRNLPWYPFNLLSPEG